MRKISFLIFISIALSVYGSINYYIFIRGWEAMLPDPTVRMVYIYLFLYVSLSYVIGRVLERFTLSWFSSIFVWQGAFYLAAMVYFLFFVIAIDVLRLVNYIVPFFPAFITAHYIEAKFITMLIVVDIVVLLVLAGYANAKTPKIKTLELSIAKKANGMKEINIVVASDIHLGTIINKARLETIVERINSLKPDLVLLPGDVVDEDIGPVIKQNLGETLRTIKSKYGVVAITGNHEYIGGAEAACRYLTEHGIVMLRDASIKINDSIWLVGREDLSARQFGGVQRKPLEKLMAAVDKRLPVILMDHQPFRLEDGVKNGADVQLSGHTHHGQMFPFNFITKKVFELSWGYKKKENTHIYVSCGVGTWGPPVRIGSRSEIIHLKLKFE